MGSVNLDNTGSGSAITLSSDGTSLLLDGTAVGGGSPDLYAENYTSGTKPATTGTNAVAIGKGSSAAGTEAIAMVDGTADSQDSFAVGGIVQSAIGGYAIGKSAQVYSQYGLALGQSSLVSASSYGTAVGYQSVAGANSAVAFAKSRASGSDSLAGAIANNTTSYGATSANSIALGRLAKASNTGGNAIGWGATSTHEYSSAFGVNATTTNSHQVALGGSGYTVLVSGAYKFPTADGSANQVLQTNGSGVLSFATAVVASTTLGAVGTYAMMQNRSGTASIPAGNTVAGTGLSYHNINYSVSGTPAASGTWRVMGRFSSSGTGSLNAISVCVRIS